MGTRRSRRARTTTVGVAALAVALFAFALCSASAESDEAASTPRVAYHLPFPAGRSYLVSRGHNEPPRLLRDLGDRKDFLGAYEAWRDAFLARHREEARAVLARAGEAAEARGRWSTVLRLYQVRIRQAPSAEIRDRLERHLEQLRELAEGAR